MHIILIHGTFARFADWTEKDSDFCEFLRAKFPDVSIENHFWTGHNSINDRYGATQNLIEKIKERNSESLFLIGHSHGGNIAVNCLKSDEVNIQGIVTINTPFFYELRFDFQWIIRLIIRAILWGLIALTLFGIHYYNSGSFNLSSYKIELNPVSVFLLVFTLILILFSEMSSSFARYISKISLKRNESYRNKTIPNRVQEVPLYCVSTGDDEVFGFLQLLDNIANFLSFLLGRWSYRIYIVVGMVLLLVYSCCIMTIHGINSYGLVLLSGACCMAPIVTVFYAVLILLSTFLSYLLRGIPQGNYRLSWSHLYTRTIITLVPKNYSKAIFEQIFPKESTKYFLSHSSLYEDHDALEKITKWMSSVQSTVLPKTM